MTCANPAMFADGQYHNADGSLFQPHARTPGFTSAPGESPAAGPGIVHPSTADDPCGTVPGMIERPLL